MAEAAMPYECIPPHIIIPLTDQSLYSMRDCLFVFSAHGQAQEERGIGVYMVNTKRGK